MINIYYPSEDKIIELNILALTLIKIKKGNVPKLLNYKKLSNILEDCKNKEGDIYDKAVVLFKGLIKGHVFASGNRRTAFIVTRDFIMNNKEKFRIKNQASEAKIMTGIREDYYKDNEIKEWIKNGKIKEFKR